MSALVLKLIAIAAMVVDHIGYVFFPQQMAWRLLGRLTFPIFAYMAAEGAFYTHDRKRYLLRLLVWAAVAEVPFDLMCSGTLVSMDAQNVCWTLAAGVACVYLMESKSGWRYAGIALLMLASTLLMTDYMFPGMAAVMVMYHYNRREQRTRGVLLGCLVLSAFLGLPQLACVLAAVPLHFYNGKQGPRLKYLFYAFYPVHMLVIWAIYSVIGGGAA